MQLTNAVNLCIICLAERMCFYQEASTLIEKAGLEEKKLYMSTLSANQPALKSKDRDAKDEKDRPPPPPVLISRTDYSLSFVPAPYHTKEQVRQVSLVYCSEEVQYD